MSSIIPGYEYDIFISYRQKDNRGYKWVSEFVEELTTELESTFKEEIRIYFDINPHDGLLETHDVDASLKEKLKCLVFIPIISRTYCDPISFAWEHEFKAFVNLASQDKFGLKVRLPGGNVGSRVLPVRIYDLTKEDVQLCEAVLKGPLRGIEFIYKSAGVNRPLRANEDHSQDNLNKTYYRDQINKLSSSIQDIIYGLRSEQTVVTSDEKVPYSEAPEVDKPELKIRERRLMKMSGSKVLYGILLLLFLTTLVFAYPKIFNRDSVKNVRSEEILEKAIRVCDPLSYWSNYTGKIHLTYVRADGNVYSDQIIEIQTKEDYYKCTSVFFGKFKAITGIIDGKCLKEIENPEEDQVKNLGLDCDLIFMLKNHHYCLFGLLMELKASGLSLDDKVQLTEFQGDDCLALKFISDPAKIIKPYFIGTDWTVYIDPATNDLLGYKREGVLNSYSVITSWLESGFLRIPLCTINFNNQDNSFQSVELITIPTN